MTERNLRDLLKEIRRAFADYVAGSGCGCCGDSEKADEAMGRLGKLVRMKKYSDGSGYDWSRYKTK